MDHRLFIAAAVAPAALIATAPPALAYQSAGVAELLRQGDFWAQRGRRDLAEQAYHRVLQIEPGNERALRGLRGSAPAPTQSAPAPARPSVSTPAQPRATPPAAVRAPAQVSASDRLGRLRVAGFQALDRGDLAAAERDFQSALGQRASDREAAGGLGLVRLRQGRFAEARDLLQRASAGGDASRWREALESAGFYAGLQEAETAADAGDAATAERRLTALIASADGDERAQANARLAGLLADQGRYEEAARRFEAAADEAGDAATASENRRRALQASAAAAAARGDTVQAETLYQQALSSGGSQDVWLRFAFAGFLLDQGRDSDAAAIAMPLETAGAEGLYAAALFYERTGRSGDAARVLRRLPADARGPQVQALEAELRLGEAETRARSLADQGRLSEALAALDQARGDAVTPAALTRLGTAYADLGREPQAAALARDAAAGASVGGLDAQRDLVALLARTGQDEAALNLIQRATGGARDTAAARALYSELAVASAERLREEGRQAEAFEVLRSAWDLAPDDPDILVALGRLYRSGDLNTESAQVFQMALARRDDDPGALSGLADAASASGDHAAARRAANRLIALRPREAQTYLTAANVERAAGDRRAARRYLEQAAALETERDRLRPGQAFSASNPFRDTRAVAAAPNPFDPASLRGEAGAGTGEGASAGRGSRAGAAQAALADLARETAPRVDGSVAFRSRSGEEGLSQVGGASASAQASVGFAGGRVGVTVAPVVVDAGSPARSAQARFGRNATAEALAIVAQEPATLASIETQYDAGVAVTVGYESDLIQADVGSTPLGFRQTDLQGGLSWRPRLGAHGVARLFFERRPVTDSLLSYASAVDPVTGERWGGVMRTGGGLGLSWDRDGTGVYGDAAYRSYSGERVASNDAVEVNLGAYRRLYAGDALTVGAGAAVNYQAFDRNLGYFTFGHGGYFSPQSFASLSFPIRAEWRQGGWSVTAQAAPGFQTYQQDAAPIYPTLPVEQAALDALKAENADVRAQFDSASRSGFAFSGRLEAWYDLPGAMSVGGDFGMNTFGDYDEYLMTLRLKQTFGARP